ncbi:MAG: DUF4115 domain-containing protein [Endomicrobium sp.]|jgi:cytoskeletal protein RodZ|nr:DUF4115 domain-containing protein [Endomicrobium sp.]
MKVIGSILKTKREEEGLSLEQVHKAIKVQEKYLTAMEEGDDKAFSAEVYYKSFLKSYAKYLGLDANTLINQYEVRKIPQNVSEENGADGNKSGNSKSGGNVNLKKATATVLVAVCLLTAFLYLNKNISNIVSEDFHEHEYENAAAEAGPKDETQSVPQVLAEPEPEVKPAAAPKKQNSAPAVPSRQKLLVRAVENVWIKVDSDTRGLYEGTLLKGEERTWQTNNGFNLKIGYTPGVKVFFNDEEVDVISGSVQDVNTLALKRQ